ncbi:MAG: hypothetical protein KDK70_04300 [Myxococcales bacterium]|nr:hypothetical protein [Myxococcales bacterium]
MRGLAHELATSWRPTLAAGVCLAAGWVLADQLEPHYALEDWLVWPVARLWVYVLLYTAACVGVGHLLLRRLWSLSMPLAETWLLSKAVGLVVFVLGLYGAGAAGAFTPSVALGLPILLVLVSWRDLSALVRRTVDELRASRPPSTGGRWLIRVVATAGGVLGFGLLYAMAFTPEAISVDAAWYHLPIAQDYARAGAIIPFPSEYNRAFPHLASMIYTWGLLLPGVERPFTWMLALHLEFVLLVWKAVAVTVAAQWMLGDYELRGLWTGFFLFPLVLAFAHGITGGSEHFVGLWAVPMFIATCRMLPSFDLRWAALLGVLSGGAILSKYQAIYMIAACGSMIAARWLWLLLVLAWRRRLPFGARRLWLAPVLVVGLGLCVCSPHFIKNLLFYGDPLYPFLQATLDSAHPTHELADYLFRGKLGAEGNRPTAVGLQRVEEAARLFVLFGFQPHYVVVKQAWPLFGSLFTLLLPALVFLRRSVRIWLGAWCCFVVIAVWSNTYLQDRYLNAAVPLFAATTVAIMVRLWTWGALTRVCLLPVVGLQLAWSADTFTFSGHRLIASSLELGRSGWEGRLDPKERFPYRRTFDFVSEATPPDAQVLVRGTREVVGLDRFAQRDVMWQQASFFYEPLTNAAEVWQHYRERGVTHVVWREHRHSAGTLQSTVLFDDLVHRSGMPLTRSHGWVLMELPPEPPRAEPYLYVLVLDQRPLYADGLYRADDLRLFGELDQRQRGRVQPRRRVEAPQELVAAMGEAHVVLVGRQRRLPPEAARRLSEQFVDFESYERDGLYLRKLDAPRR